MHSLLLSALLVTGVLLCSMPVFPTDVTASNTMARPRQITPFLWFDDNAEEAAEFYLSVFPEARKVGELRSSGVGPWPAGKIANITIELMVSR